MLELYLNIVLFQICTVIVKSPVSQFWQAKILWGYTNIKTHSGATLELLSWETPNFAWIHTFYNPHIYWQGINVKFLKSSRCFWVYLGLMAGVHEFHP